MPGSAGRPAAACSLSAQAGLSRCWLIFQLTLSQTWCRSNRSALNTALVSRHTCSWPLPTSMPDAAGRVLPMKWLCLLRPCSRRVCITALRCSVATCSTTPSSSLNRALRVSSWRRAATWVDQFLASPLSMRLSEMPSPSVTSMSTFSATPTWPAKAISATLASRPPSLRSW
ncbi:hypothetical protein Y695_03070 [Hydrogenophaga sp. T4]|nr:hypothetical protein Y695_03070 [Hydrogenophaga sp. T4]